VDQTLANGTTIAAIDPKVSDTASLAGIRVENVTCGQCSTEAVTAIPAFSKSLIQNYSGDFSPLRDVV